MNKPIFSDEELLKLVAEDNTEAFKILFDQYYNTLVRVLMRFSQDPEQVKDWVQEIYVKLWECRKNLDIDSIGNFKAYFMVIARNHAIKHHTKKKKLELVSNYELTDYDVSDNNLVENLEHAELMHAYQKALSKLPHQATEAFFLNREKGLTYTKISEELGISIKTVEAQISKVMSFLRQELVVYLR